MRTTSWTRLVEDFEGTLGRNEQVLQTRLRGACSFGICASDFIVLLSASSSLPGRKTTADNPISEVPLEGVTLKVFRRHLDIGSAAAGSALSTVDLRKSSVLFRGGSDAFKGTYSNIAMDGPRDATGTSTPNVYGSSSSSNLETSSNVPSGTTVNLSGTIGSGGDYYLWLGDDLGPYLLNRRPALARGHLQ